MAFAEEDPAFRGCSRLHIAAEHSQISEITQLLNAGADVNARIRLGPHRGQTPLHRAMVRDLFRGGKEKNTLEVVKLLLDVGADVNARSNKNVTPLHFAAWGCKIEVVEILIKHGADINIPDDDGKTPLHGAVREPIDRARKKNTLAVVGLLLNAGADINVHDKSGETPLHNALSGKPEVVELLLAYGADVNAPNNDGKTSLHAAVELRETLAVVKLLLNAGANANACDKLGKTPLHIAALWSRKPIVLEILIKHGADIEAPDKNGKTPLYNAVKNYKSVEIGVTNLLLDSGADVHTRAKDGQTPLHVAVESRGIQIPAVVEALIKHGADVNARDKIGEMPLHIAQRDGLPQVVKLLLDAGAFCQGFSWLSRSRYVTAPPTPPQEPIPENNWKINQTAKKLLLRPPLSESGDTYLLILMSQMAIEKEWDDLQSLLTDWVMFETPKTQMERMLPDYLHIEDGAPEVEGVSKDEAREILAETVEFNLRLLLP